LVSGEHDQAMSFCNRCNPAIHRGNLDSLPKQFIRDSRRWKIQSQYLRLGKRLDDLVEHLITLDDIFLRSRPRQVRIAAEGLLLKADDADCKIGNRMLSHPAGKNRKFVPRLPLKDAQVICVDQEFHEPSS
jgi:hypothetical protein